MPTSSSSHSRDVALRRLSRCNRWLLAGSVTLTGVFSALAAQAFPGKTRSAKGVGTSGKASRSRHHARDAHATHKVSRAKALKSPAQAPEAASSTSTQASGETQATNTEQAATSTQAASTPEVQTTTTEQTTTPTETAQTTETPTSSGSSSETSSSSESSSAPVVSGGS
jgi:hypothetical protein